MHFSVILANITGSISLWWLAMFQTLLQLLFLDIFIKSEFSERRFLTIPQIAPVYGGLQYPQEISELYEFQWQL